MAQILARLAVARARTQEAIATAADCGDREWVRTHRDYLDSLDRRIATLLRVLRREVIAEARNITNAPI